MAAFVRSKFHANYEQFLFSTEFVEIVAKRRTMRISVIDCVCRRLLKRH